MEQIKAFTHWLQNQIKTNAPGKSWMVRAPLLLIMLWVFGRHLSDPNYESIIGRLNLGIHELGHLAFNLTRSEIWGFMGGTLLQLAIPLGSIAMFWKQKDFYAIGFALTWLSTNLFHVAWYIGSCGDDVHSLYTLPGSGGEAMHDWIFMLSYWGVLESYPGIAIFVYILAILFMISGLAFMAWVLKILYKHGDKPAKKVTKKEDDFIRSVLENY